MATALIADIDLAELADEPWLLREVGSGTREIFEEMIAAKLGAPRIKMELNRAEAIKQATADGHGLACISQLSVWREIENGSLATIKVANLPLKRHFYMIRHKSKYASRVLKQFSEFVLSHSCN